MYSTCHYCKAETVMVKNRQTGNWRMCEKGTTRPHRCNRWPPLEPETGATTVHSLATVTKEWQELCNEGLERAADDGWPVPHTS